LGKFLQVDPMADKYGSLTTYNYAGNNPVIFNDPNGDDFWDDIMQLPSGSTWENPDKEEQDYQPGVSPFGWMQEANARADAMFDAMNGVYNPLWNQMQYGAPAPRIGAGGGQWVKVTTDIYNKMSITGTDIVLGYEFSHTEISYRYEENAAPAESGIITITVTSEITGEALLRAYPDRVRDEQGRTVAYKVPLYKVVVSDGKYAVNFKAIRYGVERHGNGTPKITGINSGSYIGEWGDYLGGIHVDGAGNGGVWIHKGPADGYLGAAIDCVEIYGGQWEAFRQTIEIYGGGSQTTVGKTIVIIFQPATPPPLVVDN
jgi:hypothetical protein